MHSFYFYVAFIFMHSLYYVLFDALKLELFDVHVDAFLELCDVHLETLFELCDVHFDTLYEL